MNNLPNPRDISLVQRLQNIITEKNEQIKFKNEKIRELQNVVKRYNSLIDILERENNALKGSKSSGTNPPA